MAVIVPLARIVVADINDCYLEVAVQISPVIRFFYWILCAELQATHCLIISGRAVNALFKLPSCDDTDH